MTTRPIRLENEYLVITGFDVESVRGGEAFWSRLELEADHRERVGSGWLVAAFTVNEDWAAWEMHPAADEIVQVTAGRLRMTLDRDGVRESVTLGGGETVVVPAGVWHTVDVVEPGATLNITHGPGTEHRPRDATSD